MSEPYLGEIRMFGGNFAPRGWMFCDGSILSIAQNDALFALLGTTYGGDGQETFQLPDLRGRVPVHVGSTIGPLGTVTGTETVTLTSAQVPAHTHPLVASTATATSTSPAGNVLAQANVAGVQIFMPTPASGASSSMATTPGGGSQPHDNMMPFRCITFIIAVEGIFPSQG